jgi:hypothetical protein
MGAESSFDFPVCGNLCSHRLSHSHRSPGLTQAHRKLCCQRRCSVGSANGRDLDISERPDSSRSPRSAHRPRWSTQPRRHHGTRHDGGRHAHLRRHGRHRSPRVRRAGHSIPLRASGNAEIDQTVNLPSGCFGPLGAGPNLHIGGAARLPAWPIHRPERHDTKYNAESKPE